MSMSRPLCAITGPTSGIGEATALELARQHFDLLLLCRNPERGEVLAHRCRELGAGNVDVQSCDLSSLESVRSCAQQILANYDYLEVLINNAGVVCNRRQLSSDGFELMFATNHLGPFLLTNLLLPLLVRAQQGRIINVSSGAHGFVKGINFDDLNYHSGFSTFKVYGHSKLCNLLFTLALSDRTRASHISVNALHPGAVTTNLGAQNGWYVKPLYAVLGMFFRSPQRGAQSSVYLATQPEGASSKGQYFYDSKAIAPKPWALDRDAASRLWDISAQLTSIVI
jgi:retinol dehydrogenase-12